MLERKSAGAVVFTEIDGERYYLLLLYGAGHWDLPKGGIERGESELDTVRREVREETGIEDLVIIDGFRKVINYFYKSGSALVRKTVVFYLAKTPQTEVRLSHEHNAYAWLKMEDAMVTLTYKTAKEVLFEANQFIFPLERSGYYEGAPLRRTRV
ncbi:MAG: NUDIX domain-containing protein [Aigarchaeota archaeon]|nr:NUDIX domain-containing protein [Aigarchaeota archaeon]